MTIINLVVWCIILFQIFYCCVPIFKRVREIDKIVDEVEKINPDTLTDEEAEKLISELNERMEKVNNKDEINRLMKVNIGCCIAVVVLCLIDLLLYFLCQA